MEQYISYWKNFVNFSGRSTRSEFWIPVLFNMVISAILAFISQDVEAIFSLIILIPSLANEIRRLHDINKSGWNVLWALVPIVGWIIILIYFCTDTVEEGNNYSE